MKVRHLPIVTDLVIWNDTDAALDELKQLGLTDGDYHFEDTVGDSRRTLVVHTAKGDDAALPDWAVVKDVVGDGFFTVPPDVTAAVYEPHIGALS